MSFRNRPQRIFLAGLVLVLVASLLPELGCGEKKNPLRTTTIQMRQLPPEFQADVGPVVEGNTAFALSLYSRLRGTAGNLFLSPYSISTALAMTWAGARGQTELEMAQALHFPLPQERLHLMFGALNKSLETGSGLGGYRLNVANRLWGQSGDTWLQPFLNITRTAYGAELQQLDFRSDPEACRGQINDWISDRTEGKITELFSSGDLTNLTKLVLTNAIYFKGQWETQFDPTQTKDSPFTLASGEKVYVPIMNMEGKFLFATAPHLSVLILPYSGRDLSMVFLLPTANDSLPALEQTLTPENLAGWVGGANERQVTVRIPRFRIVSKFPLGSILSGMGMPSAFQPSTADFSGMNGKRDLLIYRVTHKALVEVNEEGTEAAGATGVVVGPTSAGPEFTADHPFIFLIRDEVTGSILFLGRLLDPR